MHPSRDSKIMYLFMRSSASHLAVTGLFMESKAAIFGGGKHRVSYILLAY